MNTKLLLTASALFMAACGVLGTFLPQELLAYLGIPTSAILTILIQLMAALYLAFGMLNWTAKDSLIGGIYNRPVAIGNLTHFLVGALALAKAAYAQPIPILIAGAVIYAVFAVGFAMVMFGSPVKPA
jgi:Fe2+ transport system protein B